MKPRIFTLLDWYLPGFKAGGQLRTICNMVELVGSEFDFFILTRDRDLLDPVPYPGVPVDHWTIVGRAKVLYTADFSFRTLRRRIIEIAPDVVYFNSFFSRITTKVLLLRRLRLLPQCAAVLAPRGEFSPGALTLKHLKKSLFLRTAFSIGLYRSISWHASTEAERNDIAKAVKRFGARMDRMEIVENTKVAIDVPYSEFKSQVRVGTQKAAGSARLVFVSRVSPKKNLLQAIINVSALAGDVSFDIYGPVEDTSYWAACQQHMTKARTNVKISYCGAIPHNQIQNVLSEYHFFIFPTLGENFGHVIFEALSAGCPVVISDQTPWSQVEERGAGRVVPLTNTRRWQAVLQTCVDMDEATYANMSQEASSLAQEWSQSPAIREDNLKLFASAVSAHSTI